MLFSHKLLRIFIVPLSASLGTVCSFSLILVQPVQSNLDSKLPECKSQSPNSTHISDLKAKSEFSYRERVLIEQSSGLASQGSPNCHKRSEPMEQEVETRQKPQQQESAHEGQRINLSSSPKQSLNSHYPSAILPASALEHSQKVAIDKQGSSLTSAGSHQQENKTQPIQTDSQGQQEPLEQEVKTKKQSGPLSYVERNSIEQLSSLAAARPHQQGNESEAIQTDSQRKQEPLDQEVKTKKQSGPLSYVERKPIEQLSSLAAARPHQQGNESEAIQTDSQAEQKPTEQKLEIRGEKEQPESASDRRMVNLTLADTVNLAVQNNRTIKNSYLQRIIDRQELAVAEDEFAPNFTPEVFLGFNQRLERDTQELSVSGDLEVKMPTGGTLGVISDNIGQGIGISELDFRVTFDQPLLRGFGVDVNLAPIEIARLEETVNQLTLKSTLIGTITDAIEAYLRLLQAQEQIKIEQLALENAKRRLEIIQALIDAGRRARVELVQSETDVANREVSLLAAQNRLAQAQLDLIEILDLDRNLELAATDIEKAAASISLEFDKLTQLAFANNPEYLQSLSRLEIAKFNLLLAENEKLWDLDLQVSYGLTNRIDLDDQTDVRAGIILSREFGNLSLEQSVERSQVRLEQANNNLQETHESLEIEVKNRIRDVQFNLKQIELARRARELSEKQLENEREKLRLGVRGVRLIDVLNFENDLVQAKNRELNTMIDYLSALTRLEQTVGITLDKWNIKVESPAVNTARLVPKTLLRGKSNK